jgi:hypothetical protein
MAAPAPASQSPLAKSAAELTPSRKNNPCGAQAPDRVNATSTSSSASAPSSASTGSFGTFGGNSNGAGAAFRTGEVVGLGFVAAALFAGFAMVV